MTRAKAEPKQAGVPRKPAFREKSADQCDKEAAALAAFTQPVKPTSAAPVSAATCEVWSVFLRVPNLLGHGMRHQVSQRRDRGV